MNKYYCFSIVAVLFCFILIGQANAQKPTYFSGFYGGVEVGAFSYNTQITFDGVDDPAGRGGFGYGAFLGYNKTYGKLLVGTEFLINWVAEPDPYTFDPSVVGFAELDLKRGASAGIDFKGGYLISNRVLLYGTIGYFAHKQSVFVDETAIDQYAGGSSAKRFGTIQFGLGLEAAIRPQISIRITIRTFAGHDLNKKDFGAIPVFSVLNRFDVEPSEQQFLAGLVLRL